MFWESKDKGMYFFIIASFYFRCTEVLCDKNEHDSCSNSALLSKLNNRICKNVSLIFNLHMCMVHICFTALMERLSKDVHLLHITQTQLEISSDWIMNASHVNSPSGSHVCRRTGKHILRNIYKERLLNNA